jgi:galactonate dehydratase
MGNRGTAAVSGKITGYETAIVGNPWKNWFFLKLETDDGVIGYGEASLNGFPQTVEMAVRELQGYFMGKSAFEVNKILPNMLSGVYSDGGQIHRAAMAAVEAACWDIVGKSNGRPLWDLWGGRVRDQIRLYANGWYQEERIPEAWASRAVAAIKMGYTALKFDPFGESKGAMSIKERDLSLEIVRAVKDAVPPETDLMIEGHCRFDVPTALLLAHRLTEFDVLWFEEPVSHRNVRGLIEVAQRAPVRIATGENFTTFGEFFELCSGSLNLVLQPDVANLGGLKAGRQVCELGEALNIPVAPHDAQGPLSKALCLQLAAISPAILIQEDFEEFNPEWTRTLATSIEKKDGGAIIPDSPGIGRSIHWETLAEHPYDPDATLTLFQAGWEQRTGKGSSA